MTEDTLCMRTRGLRIHGLVNELGWKFSPDGLDLWRFESHLLHGLPRCPGTLQVDGCLRSLLTVFVFPLLSGSKKNLLLMAISRTL